ncbi:MAG: PEP-CTERM sorting domain-containing protein [Deltaproteobacteria bacterium]|nr:PEP-CTERM sorting domain-containing protein [Deltaproteobacteria bacterium]
MFKIAEKMRRLSFRAILYPVMVFLLVFAGPASADTYLPYGLDYGVGWFDANKTYGNPEDDLMCWAAAASNILAWGGWGTAVYSNEDLIWQNFQYHWTDEGGIMAFGWQWWFDGTNPAQGESGWSQINVPGGGNHYSYFDFGDYYHQTSEKPSALSAIDAYLHAGYGVTIGIYTATGGGHALTIWGYEYADSDPGTYTGLIFSDSDDYKSADGSKKDLWLTALNYSSDRWYLGGSAWYIGEVEALERNPAPEPLTILLFGSGLVFIAGWRRKTARG